MPWPTTSTCSNAPLQVGQNEVELSTAKYSRLPDLNASIGGDASFGRVLSSDNAHKDNNQTSGSLNISTSLPVFQGMRINRQVKGGKLDLAAAMQDLERAREDVSINVMTLYLEVLYNKGTHRRCRTPARPEHPAGHAESRTGRRRQTAGIGPVRKRGAHGQRPAEPDPGPQRPATGTAQPGARPSTARAPQGSTSWFRSSTA